MTWLAPAPATPEPPSKKACPSAASPGRTETSAGLLLASGCGTAVAAVCASGLVVLTQQAAGLWAALSVLCGGSLAWAVARCLSRLAEHIPSRAGLLAYLGRPLGQQAALLLALPYFLLSLFLVGAEATLLGRLLSYLIGHRLPVPPVVFALGFVFFTWLLCRRGAQISLRSQAVCTWALLAGLSLCAVLSLGNMAAAGSLGARLFQPPPSLTSFLGAVAQSLFLFMGFELVTSQTAPLPVPVLRRALVGSVGLLTAFYALLAIAVSACHGSAIGSLAGLPQLSLAQQAAGLPAVATITLLSALASYTSVNGALLALSRLCAALASLGSLPHSWAQVDGRCLLPRRALFVLLLCGTAATWLVHSLDLLFAAILAAAPTAAVLYAALAVAREALAQRPDLGTAQKRPLWRRVAGYSLAALFVGLALAVLLSVCDPPAGSGSSLGPPPARHVLTIWVSAYTFSIFLVFSRRLRRKRIAR